MIHMNCGFWGLETQVPVEANWCEELVTFCMFLCLCLKCGSLYDLQMNVPIGWGCYKTFDGLLFLFVVFFLFLSNLDGIFESHSGFCEEM